MFYETEPAAAKCTIGNRQNNGQRVKFFNPKKSYPLFLWITEGYFLSIFFLWAYAASLLT